MFHLVYVPHPSRTPVNRLDAEIFLVFQPPHQRTLSAGPTQRHFKTSEFFVIFTNHFHHFPQKQTNPRQIPDESAGWKNPAAAPSLPIVVGDLAQSSWPRSSCTWIIIIIIITWSPTTIIIINPMLEVKMMVNAKEIPNLNSCCIFIQLESWLPDLKYFHIGICNTRKCGY